jgi:hypothetical protein
VWEVVRLVLDSKVQLICLLKLSLKTHKPLTTLIQT